MMLEVSRVSLAVPGPGLAAAHHLMRSNEAVGALCKWHSAQPSRQAAHLTSAVKRLAAWQTATISYV